MSKGQPDPEACFATLEEPEREAVETFADTLGLDDWSDCPPLRRVVVTVAALRMSADMHPGLSTAGKLREACWTLGAGPSSTRLAASIRRQLRRWQGADVRPRDSRAGATIDPPDILSSTSSG